MDRTTRQGGRPRCSKGIDPARLNALRSPAGLDFGAVSHPRGGARAANPTRGQCL